MRNQHCQLLIALCLVMMSSREMYDGSVML